MVSKELETSLTEYLKIEAEYIESVAAQKSLLTKIEHLDRQKSDRMGKVAGVSGLGPQIRERHVLLNNDKSASLIRLRYLEGLPGKIEIVVLQPETVEKKSTAIPIDDLTKPVGKK